MKARDDGWLCPPPRGVASVWTGAAGDSLEQSSEGLRLACSETSGFVRLMKHLVDLSLFSGKRVSSGGSPDESRKGCENPHMLLENGPAVTAPSISQVLPAQPAHGRGDAPQVCSQDSFCSVQPEGTPPGTLVSEGVRHLFGMPGTRTSEQACPSGAPGLVGC